MGGWSLGWLVAAVISSLVARHAEQNWMLVGDGLIKELVKTCKKIVKKYLARCEKRQILMNVLSLYSCINDVIYC